MITALSLLSLTVGPAPAHAATRYNLTGVAAASGVTTTSTAIKLSARFLKNGKVVKKATALLQYAKGGTWVTEKKVSIRSGKGSVKVKHSVGDRTYRFTVKGKATSASFVVHFVPATFVVAGSGWGHGVGMAQWGAYEHAREGRSAKDILGYYYPGSIFSTANNNPRTVRVQVLGPPADSRTTTTLSISGGAFTITDGTTILATTTAKKPIAVGVAGSKVTAKVTLANGKARTLSAARLLFRWSSSATVAVAGAHGAYRYGNLQATVIRNRPNIVNELKMNTEYLYGIDEMPSSWGSAAGGGIEALKAQVVAARTYVITQAATWKTKDPLGTNPACDCQVFDDSRSQNFTGAKKAAGAANEPWRRAVDATVRANAAQPDGSEVDVLRTPTAGLAETPYFASSGSIMVGRVTVSGTAANADAWGTTPVSYLTHVADPYSVRAPGNPHVRWTRTLSQAKAAALFGVGPLRSVEVTDRYPGGLARSVTATSVTGITHTMTYTSELWRTKLGLPGAWVSGITGR